MGMGGYIADTPERLHFRWPRCARWLQQQLAHPVPEAPISDRYVESFTATCAKFERRISGQKRDGRLITRLSPLLTI